MPAERERVLAEASSRDDAELDRLLGHDALKALLEREERGVDRVLERELVVVPAPPLRISTSPGSGIE